MVHRSAALVLCCWFSSALAQTQIPAQDYVQEPVAGWTVMVNPLLVKIDKHTADSAIAHLRTELFDLEEILPDAAIAQLKAMPIWLEYRSQGRKQFQFFLSREQLGENIPEKAGSLEIVAGEYVNPKYRQTMPLLRYLMRAYLYRVIGDSNPVVISAFGNAKSLPVYTAEHATALESVEQYFVLSSQAFYTSNWHEPVDRESLQEQDSLGYEMVRTLWRDDGKIYAPPPDGRYVEAEVLGWTLVVDTQLIDKDTFLLKRSLALIGKELHALNELLPEHALALMRKAKIYVVVAEGDNIARYWPTINKRRLSPISNRRAGNIEIVAKRYIRAIRRNDVDILLHELTHALHDRLSAEIDKQIEATYRKAMAAKLFKGKYAAKDHHEYFAELSAIYFGKNLTYPPERFDLKTYDPEGYEMIKTTWHAK